MFQFIQFPLLYRSVFVYLFDLILPYIVAEIKNLLYYEVQREDTIKN